MGFFSSIGKILSGSIGGIISGGASLLSGILTNSANKELARESYALTQDQFNQSLEFNSAQSAIARQFSAQEATIARTFNSQEAQAQRTFSAQEAQKARNWYTKMSNTAHQREVKDLRSAGLNPILSANSGAPVSASPSASGSAASAQAAQSAMASASGGGSFHAPTMQDVGTNAINTGRDIATAGMGIEEAEARIDKMSVEAENILADTNLKEEQKLELIQKIINLKAQALEIVSKTRFNDAQAYQRELQNIEEKVLQDWLATDQAHVILKNMGLHKGGASVAIEGVKNTVNSGIEIIKELWETLETNTLSIIGETTPAHGNTSKRRGTR